MHVHNYHKRYIYIYFIPSIHFKTRKRCVSVVMLDSFCIRLALTGLQCLMIHTEWNMWPNCLNWARFSSHYHRSIIVTFNMTHTYSIGCADAVQWWSDNSNVCTSELNLKGLSKGVSVNICEGEREVEGGGREMIILLYPERDFNRGYLNVSVLYALIYFTIFMLWCL